MSKWFENLGGGAAPKLRLFCFHHAGGNASMFRPWRAPNLEIWSVLLPGRGRRLDEAPFENLHALATVIANEMSPLLNVPYAFFGHSMGALLAFEVTRRIMQQDGLLPEHLLVSAERAPHLPRFLPPVSAVDRTSLVNHLRELGGTAEEVLASDEWLDSMLPTIRADFKMVEEYRIASGPTLNVAISAFSGREDTYVRPEEVLQWSRQTTGPFSCQTLPGSHFYFDPAKGFPAPLLARLNDCVFCM